jgi:RHS repeat-associated protein
MQLASGSHIPDGLLAANALLSEKLHQGFTAPKSTLHQGFSVSISSTPLGIIRPLYDEGIRSRCTGKERDTESGNDYFDARYYSSAMGRFMSPDWSAKEEPVPYATMDDPQSLNLYAYVRNNPLARTDPDGHCCWDEATADEAFKIVEESPAGQAVANFVGGTVSAGVALVSGIAGPILKADMDAGGPASTGMYPTTMNSSNSNAPAPAAPAGDPHAPGDVPNGQVVVRGGQGAPPATGTYSGAQGATEEEAGKGVPHGTVSTTTGGEIRAAGGDVRPAPEPAHPGGPINGQHVNVTGGQSAFGPPHPNPAPKPQRIPSAPKPPNQ